MRHIKPLYITAQLRIGSTPGPHVLDPDNTAHDDVLDSIVTDVEDDLRNLAERLKARYPSLKLDTDWEV